MASVSPTDGLDRNAQHLGHVHCRCGAATRQVGGSFHQADTPVLLQANNGAGRAGDVVADGGGHPAASIRAAEGGSVVGMGLGCLQRLHVPDFLVGDAGDAAGALFGGIKQPEIDGIHGKLGGQFVNQGLSGEPGGRTQRGPVRSDLGFVYHHVVAFRAHVGDVIWREDGH